MGSIATSTLSNISNSHNYTQHLPIITFSRYYILHPNSQVACEQVSHWDLRQLLVHSAHPRLQLAPLTSFIFCPKTQS